MSAARKRDRDAPARRSRWRRLIRRIVITIVIVAVAIQFVPYGRDHANPPVTATITWDAQTTEDLFMSACADCHSNLTKWPWYTNVAPASWLVQRDVDEGRSALNVSDAARGIEMDEVEEAIREGEMPPWQYTLAHSGAKLSDADREALAAGMRATFAGRIVAGGDGED